MPADNTAAPESYAFGYRKGNASAAGHASRHLNRGHREGEAG